jgi:hypothetical protein
LWAIIYHLQLLQLAGVDAVHHASGRGRVSARNFAVSVSGRPAFSNARAMLRVFAAVRPMWFASLARGCEGAAG